MFTGNATTLKPTISATTGGATNIESESGTTATLNGSYSIANASGSESVTCGFEWKAASGLYTSVTATNAASFSYNLTGLTTGTTYTYRAWASLDGGTTKEYGSEVTFVPTVKSSTAEPVTATLSFANIAQRTSFSTSKQVWEQNGIKLVNDKGSSSSNVADYAAPARFYKSSKITVTAPGKITKIVYDANTNAYATEMKTSIGTVSNANVTVSSDKVTVTYSTGVDVVTVAKLSGQVRMDSITVTYVAE
jgi:hypothetical protein